MQVEYNEVATKTPVTYIKRSTTYRVSPTTQKQETYSAEKDEKILIDDDIR